MSRFLACLALSILLSSCQDADAGADRLADHEANSGGELAYDSLLLMEDSAGPGYVGRPLDLVVVHGDDRGPNEVWISDALSESVIVFDETGALVRRIGAPGQGPTELEQIGPIILMEDDVGVVDSRTRTVKWFTRRAGEYVDHTPFEAGTVGLTGPVPLSETSRSMLVPLFDAEAKTSVAILDRDTGVVERLGGLPAPYVSSLEEGRRMFASFYAYPSMDRLDDDTILIAFMAYDGLFRLSLPDGNFTEAVHLPKRIRRGVRGDLWREFDLAENRRPGQPSEWASTLFELGVLPNGDVAVVHMDLEAEGEPPSVVVTARIFLTVVNPTSRVACVDIPVPGGSFDRSVVDIASRTLHVLDRRLDERLGASLWLLSVPILSLEDCPTEYMATLGAP